MSSLRKFLPILSWAPRYQRSDLRSDLAAGLTVGAYIAEQGFDPVYGARPLRRFLQHQLETRIGRALLAGDVSDGATVTVDVADDELAVTFANPQT